MYEKGCVIFFEKKGEPKIDSEDDIKQQQDEVAARKI